MRCPESDPGFWDHPVHGYVAQRELVERVARCARRERRLAVDAGAHIGVWSVSLANLGFRVHAFEPEPENYECLRENVRDFPVSTYPYGLSDRNERVAMLKPALANSGMWYAAQADDEVRAVRAQLVPLDSQGLSDVDLIKLDVEGQEGKVLLGARKTIERDQPVIVFEDNGLGQKYFGSEWIDPKRVLLGLGYIRQARVRKDEIWLPA